LLRFVACGSVDDGKSTLIGRLLYESQLIFEDQLAALEADSAVFGTHTGRLDFALLLDGLQAEREQGITIDVAYRYFSTARRRFIVADAPGHEQYTRNMATGASNAELAVILVDARKGLLAQTLRHTRIVAMMGIRDVVLAVNKMDLVAYDRAAFDSIVDDYRAFASGCGIRRVQSVPVSALEGENLRRRSAHTEWYQGPSLLEYLEQVEVLGAAMDGPFRMAVQLVNRPHQDFRGFCGRIAAGVVRPGDRIQVAPSGAETQVKAIVGWEGDRTQAAAGESVTLTLADEIDVSRGDVIAAADAPIDHANQFEARLLWMSATPLVPGRPYLFKVHCKESTATVVEIRHRDDVNTGAELAASNLHLNETGVVTIATAQVIAYAPFEEGAPLGGFILIDKLTFETVAVGMIRCALTPASSLRWQTRDVDRTARARQKDQRARCIWFTGLSGSGKSTIANGVERSLYGVGTHTYLLDGDSLRQGLNRDLGFTATDRTENIRRVAEVARILVDAGLVVLVAAISPFRVDRAFARGLFAEGEFIEVFVDTPLAECERRDPKGLYAKARRGLLPDFTGIDSPYEAPASPELHVMTTGKTSQSCIDEVFQFVV